MCERERKGKCACRFPFCQFDVYGIINCLVVGKTLDSIWRHALLSIPGRVGSEEHAGR